MCKEKLRLATPKWKIRDSYNHLVLAADREQTKVKFQVTKGRKEQVEQDLQITFLQSNNKSAVISDLEVNEELAQVKAQTIWQIRIKYSWVERALLTSRTQNTNAKLILREEQLDLQPRAKW